MTGSLTPFSGEKVLVCVVCTQKRGLSPVSKYRGFGVLWRLLDEQNRGSGEFVHNQGKWDQLLLAAGDKKGVRRD